MSVADWTARLASVDGAWDTSDVSFEFRTPTSPPLPRDQKSSPRIVRSRQSLPGTPLPRSPNPFEDTTSSLTSIEIPEIPLAKCRNRSHGALNTEGVRCPMIHAPEDADETFDPEALYNRWVLSHVYDTSSSSSISEWCTGILRQLDSYPKDSPGLSQLRLATCVMMLERAVGYLGRAGETLIGEVAKFVFSDADASELRLRDSSRPSKLNTTFSSSSGSDSPSPPTVPSHWLEKITFRDLHEKTLVKMKLVQSRAEQTRRTSVSHAMDYKMQRDDYRKIAAAAHFRAWRSTVQRLRLLRSRNVYQIGETLAKGKLSHAFASWKQHATLAKAKRDAQRIVERSQEEIQYLRRQHSRELAELEQRLAESERTQQRLAAELEARNIELQGLQDLHEDMLKGSRGVMDRQVEQLRETANKARTDLKVTEKRLEEQIQLSEKAEATVRRILSAMSNKQTSSESPTVAARPSATRFLSAIRRMKDMGYLAGAPESEYSVSENGSMETLPSLSDDTDDILPLLEDINPERVLLFWVRQCLRDACGESARQVNNFTTDLQDGENLCVVVAHCFPSHFSIDTRRVVHPRKRIDRALTVLHTPASQGGLGVPAIVTVDDVASGNAMAILLLMSLLLEKWVEVSPPAVCSESGASIFESMDSHFTKIQVSNQAWKAVVLKIRQHVTYLLLQQASSKKSEQQLIDDTALSEKARYVILRPDRLRDLSGSKVSGRVTSRGALKVNTDSVPIFTPPPALLTPGGDLLEGVVPVPELLDVKSIEKVLSDFFPELRKIYKYYSRLSPKSTEITSQEFMRFVSDCKLVDKNLSQAAIDLIFTKVNYQESNALDDRTGPRKRRGTNHIPQRELRPQGFVEALIRIAVQKYPTAPVHVDVAEISVEDLDQVPPESRAVSDRLRHLLTTDVLPRACSSEIDDFRSLVYSPKIQAVLSEYQAALHRVFSHFADKDRQPCPSLNIKEFSKLISEARLMGESLTKHDVALIFTNAQLADDHAGDEEMVHREFVEAIVAVALTKCPNVMLPPATRLTDFLARQFFPALSTKFPKLRAKELG